MFLIINNNQKQEKIIKIGIIIFTLFFSLKSFGFLEVIRVKEKIAEAVLLLNTFSELGNELIEDEKNSLKALEDISKDLKKTLQFYSEINYLSDEAKTILYPRIKEGETLENKIKRARDRIRKAKKLFSYAKKLYGIVHPSAITALEQKETNNYLKDINLLLKEKEILQEREKLYRVRSEILRRKKEQEIQDREFKIIASHSKKNGTHFFRPYRVKKR